MTNGKLSHILSVSWIYDLYRLGHAAFGDNSGEIYQKILEHIVKGFSATSGSLALRGDPGTDELTIVAGIDLPRRAMGAKVKFGEGVLGKVAQEGTPLLLNGDVSRDTRFKNKQAREETRTPLSAMCWPLKVDEAIIGVLSINNNTGIEFQTEQLQQGSVITNLVSVVIENANLHSAQKSLIHQLQEAQAQLLQSEKMASVGQLAAGIAHEINNPIGYVNSNLGSLRQYLADLLTILAAYQKLEARLPMDEEIRGLQQLKQDLDLDFLKEDSLALLSESCEGVQRVRNIVQDLKDFSHVDAAEWQMVDLHKGLDSTLNIAHNEIKYKAEIIREYGDVPLVECLPSQLNQVFMNMFVNAVHAIEENGKITIRTGRVDASAWIEIEDTGKGIAPEHLSRIFDPFFTTKPVGKGTGLGLSLSYSIIQKHKGRIDVDSCPGKGTTFRIVIPLKRASETAQHGGSDDAQST